MSNFVPSIKNNKAMISFYNSKTDAEKAYKDAFRRYKYVYLNDHVDMFGSPYWSLVKYNCKSNV